MAGFERGELHTPRGFSVVSAHANHRHLRAHLPPPVPRRQFRRWGCTRLPRHPERAQPQRQTRHRHHRLRRARRIKHGRRGADGIHRRALRCEPAQPRRREGQAPASRELHRLPQALRPREGLRRRGREHLRAHARLRHDDGAPDGQARVLREAPHLQYLRGAQGPRSRRRPPEARHADGHPDSRVRKLPARGRADSERSHRWRARSPRVGLARVGLAERGGGAAQQGHRQRHRPAQGRIADSRRTGLGLVGRPRARASVQRGLFPRTEVVSLVGLRQRHDERPWLAHERLALLGAQAQVTTDHRGIRLARAS